ncbi:MAG TPA: amidohydrolase family protein [Phycisphaerales bacterium]|nr:amidohydrolase family protein [Phycisphaerales bacterium]
MNAFEPEIPDADAHPASLRIAGRLLIDPHEVPQLGWLDIHSGRIAEIHFGEPGFKPDFGSADTLITPGFIDAHIHLPQMDSIGCDGYELLEWLDRTIFPAEIKWSDESVADALALAAYRRMFHEGTLGFAGYLTSHLHSVVAAVRAAHQLPLRAIAGQVFMDRNGPSELLGHDLARLAVSARGRFTASVNPRFAVSCTDDLLSRASRRAKVAASPTSSHQDGAFIQTHLAESRGECELVAALFPDDANYTAVYDRHGLLTPKTLLAHCVHLTPAEWQLIAVRRSVAVHCPTANLFLKSGIFEYSTAHERGVRLALGSDVAAGPDVAMPRVARAMIESAKARAMLTQSPSHIPTPAEAWSMITHGNADALGWTDSGRIDVGAWADLLLLRCPFDPDDSDLIGRLLYTWTSKYIETRILAGVPRPATT